MAKIRQAAVSGAFYPDEINELTDMVDSFVKNADIPKEAPAPKALIVPHAGYIYSGAIAGKAFALLKKAKGMIKKVVLLGASHKVGFSGIAFSTADFFESPVGNFKLDTKKAQELSYNLKYTGFLDAAHKSEHSLEVMLPFIAHVLGGDCEILPALTGDVSHDNVAELIKAVWGDEETLLVISSDLSHFLDYSSCQKIDEKTKNAIENFETKDIDTSRACGHIPICGFLKIAKEKQMKVKTLGVINSGDVGAPKQSVVGYGAWAFWE